MIRGLLVVAVVCVCAGTVNAHELRPAYLELTQLDADTYAVLFKVPAKGPDRRLALYVRMPEGCEVVVPTVSRFAGTSFVERSTVRRPGGLTGTEIHIDGLSKTLTDALVRIEHTNGTTQVHRLTPRSPSFTVAEAADKKQIMGTYVALGVEHILLGIDHLMFVLGLLLIVRGRWLLVKTITAFTVAHSITLGAAALGFVHVPQAPVEAVIALSIVFLASELLRSERGAAGLTERYPWIVAFVFGCLHGFGFAGALSEIGLPASSIPLALLTFNVGVEIGQLFFLAACLLVMALVKRFMVTTARWASTATAYAVGGVAAYWLIDRIASFW